MQPFHSANGNKVFNNSKRLHRPTNNDKVLADILFLELPATAHRRLSNRSNPENKLAVWAAKGAKEMRKTNIFNYIHDEMAHFMPF